MLMNPSPEPYQEQFPVGTRVRIVDRAQLARFYESWHHHHALEREQLSYAGHEAVVREIGFYHGGDVLYTLEGIPGIWHESCLVGIT
jgi:hypothetical protein